MTEAENKSDFELKKTPHIGFVSNNRKISNKTVCVGPRLSGDATQTLEQFDQLQMFAYH